MKIKSFLICLFLFGITKFSQSQTKSDKYINSTDQQKTAIQLADSCVKSELQKFNSANPGKILEGQLSLKNYDKSIESLDKNINSYQIKYKYNQPLKGKVLFTSFHVIVNIVTQETTFIKDKN